jgi:hypothetical protein
MKVQAIAIVVILSLVSASGNCGQQIELRKYGLATFQYSLDGANFRPIGSRHSGLATVLKEGSEAHHQLMLFHGTKLAGHVMGYAGTAIMAVGWILTVHDTDEDRHVSRVVFAGAGVGALGVIFSFSANHYLENAARIYNEEAGEGPTGMSLNLQPPGLLADLRIIVSCRL